MHARRSRAHSSRVSPGSRHRIRLCPRRVQSAAAAVQRRPGTCARRAGRIRRIGSCACAGGKTPRLARLSSGVRIVSSSAILAAAEVRIRWRDCCGHHYASRSDAGFPRVELLQNTQKRPDNEPRRLPPIGGMCKTVWCQVTRKGKNESLWSLHVSHRSNTNLRGVCPFVSHTMPSVARGYFCLIHPGRDTSSGHGRRKEYFKRNQRSTHQDAFVKAVVPMERAPQRYSTLPGLQAGSAWFAGMLDYQKAHVRQHSICGSTILQLRWAGGL
jgi:hypothetical protein